MLALYRKLFIELGRFRWFSWVTVHLIVPLDRRLYARTDGRWSVAHFGGADRAALPTLLLETVGRRTGQRRSTPLLYLRDGEDYVVVGSNFGQQRHPGWSANLLADPAAVAQIHERRQPVTARLASDDDVQRLWPRLLMIYPTWDSYTERTSRDFRVFRLTPTRA